MWDREYNKNVSNFFDVILLLDAIEHLTQPVLALQELARVLKPSGIILTFSLEYSIFISSQSFVSLITKPGHVFFRSL